MDKVHILVKKSAPNSLGLCLYFGAHIVEAFGLYIGCESFSKYRSRKAGCLLNANFHSKYSLCLRLYTSRILIANLEFNSRKHSLNGSYNT